MALKFSERQRQAVALQISETLDAMQDAGAEAENIFSPFVIYLRDRRLFYTGNGHNGMDMAVFTFQDEKGGRDTLQLPMPYLYSLANKASRLSEIEQVCKAEAREKIASALMDIFIDEGMEAREARLACRSAEKMRPAIFLYSQKKFADDI